MPAVEIGRSSEQRVSANACRHTRPVNWTGGMLTSYWLVIPSTERLRCKLLPADRTTAVHTSSRKKSNRSTAHGDCNGFDHFGHEKYAIKFETQHFVYRFRVGATAALVVLLTACGGGGSTGAVPPVTPVPVPVNQAPTPARLVEVSSSSVGTLSASWLPATDDTTAVAALRYQVHVATDPAFIPSPTTLKTTVTGALSTTITAGLTRGQRYSVRVLAVD